MVLVMGGTPVGNVGDVSTICFLDCEIVRSQAVHDRTAGVRLESDASVVRWADSPGGEIRYGRMVNWIERQLERLRSFNPMAVDGVLALIFIAVGIASVFTQEIRDDSGTITDGFREPDRAGHRHRDHRVCAGGDPASRAAAGTGDLVDRDPDPHPHRLARRRASAGRPVPHLHGRRVLPAAHRFRRVGGHRRHDRHARAHRFSRARHGRRAGHPRPVHRCLGDRRRLAEPPDGDRLEGARGRRTRRSGTSRARRGCSPRNACGSLRSCTMSWRTRCR